MEEGGRRISYSGGRFHGEEAGYSATSDEIDFHDQAADQVGVEILSVASLWDVAGDSAMAEESVNFGENLRRGGGGRWRRENLCVFAPAQLPFISLHFVI